MAMIYKQEINKPYEEVFSKVEEACKNNKFGVMKVYEFDKILEEKGFPISRKIATFEICQPKYASLTLEKKPILASFMPCRIAIEKLDDNTTLLSTILPNEIINLCDANDIKDIANEINNIIRKIIKEISGE